MSDKSARSKRLYVKKLDWKRMPGRKGKRRSNKMRKQKGWDSKKNSPKKNSELRNELQKEPPRRLTNSWRRLRISLSQSSPRIQKCRQLQLKRHQLLWKLWKPRHRLNQNKRRNKRHAKSKKSTSPRRKATDMPCMFPDSEVCGVFMSACASTYIKWKYMQSGMTSSGGLRREAWRWPILRLWTHSALL